MKQKFTILFDLDGTLIDTAPDLMMTEGDQWIDCIADKSCVEQRL